MSVLYYKATPIFFGHPYCHQYRPIGPISIAQFRAMLGSWTIQSGNICDAFRTRYEHVPSSCVKKLFGDVNWAYAQPWPRNP